MKRLITNIILSNLPRNLKFYFSKLLTKCSRLLLESGFHSSAQPQLNGEYWFLENPIIPLRYVLDGGANRGEWTKFLLQHNSDIEHLIMVEPNSLLINNLRKEYCNEHRIEIIESGLDCRKDRLPFHVPIEGDSHGTFSNYLSTMDPNFSLIKTTTIDEIIKKFKIKTLDLVKLDLEGFDHNALLGARNSLSDNKIKMIQFEVTRSWEDTGNSPCATFRLLKRARFKIYWLNKSGLLLIKNFTNIPHFSLYSNFVAIHESCNE